MDFIIDEMTKEQWDQVADIYLAGINTGKATFQGEVPTWENWDSSHLKECRLVLRQGDNIFGWAALTPVSSRCVYAGVAELSIYMGEKYRGRGLGKELLKAIVRLSEEKGFWTLQSGIIRENLDSIALHKSCGFREIGYREMIGKMSDGQWRDVVLMERRSKLVGVD